MELLLFDRLRSGSRFSDFILSHPPGNAKRFPAKPCILFRPVVQQNYSHSISERRQEDGTFHSVDNRPRRSMDDFVFTAYLLPRTPRNEELYERPWNGKKPHYVVLGQLLGVVDTSCAKLSLLMHIAMGITREDYESKSLRYKIYLRSVEALEKGEY